MANPQNLIPGGNRKGTTGVRKKATKSLVEWLEGVIDGNKAEFMQTLSMMAATEPDKYLKTMTDIFKLIIPKQIQAESQMSGEVQTGPPVINFHFNGKKPAEAQAALEAPDTLADSGTSAQEVFTLALPTKPLTQKTKKPQ